jgi:Baseplate J-like protein
MLNLQSFITLVQNMAAAVQAQASALLNFTTGSVLLAITEACASVGLWLQWLILQVLALTRLATSTGTNVDTWVGDFGLLRLPAVASTGPETFGRYSTATTGFVPVGAQVKTSDGTRIYQVLADSTNAAWNGSNGFTIAPGIASIACTVQDITTDSTGTLSIGSAGNVAANTITLPASAMTNVDYVNNASAFTNGVNAQSDASLQATFAQYVQTRSKGTNPAIGFAISQVQQGLNWTIAENVNTSGTFTPGTDVITVDDGSGNPPSTLLASVSAAINLYRPLGSTILVQGPTVTTATVVFTLTTNPTTNKTALQPLVQAAVLNYINTLPDGTTLAYTRIPMVAYLVDPSIVDVTAYTLNGGTADLVAGSGGVIKATSGTVTVN